MTFVRFIPVNFFAACENTWPGSWIRHGQWTFAITETLHIMVLGMLLGTILIVDLRLLGWGVRRQPVADAVSDLAPWTWSALALMIATGVPLFMSEAMRLGKSGPFFLKMVFLFLAILIHFFILRSYAKSPSVMGNSVGKLM